MVKFFVFNRLFIIVIFLFISLQGTQSAETQDSGLILAKTLTISVGDQKTVSLDDCHLELAQREKILSDKTLTSDDLSRNLVLAQFTILTKEKTSGDYRLVSVPITRDGGVFNTKGKIAVFESGVAGSIFAIPAYTQALQTKLLQPLKETAVQELKSMQEFKSLEDLKGVKLPGMIQGAQESYSKKIEEYKLEVAGYDFDVTQTAVQEIFRWMEVLYAVAPASKEVIKVGGEFQKDKGAFIQSESELLKEKEKGPKLLDIIPKTVPEFSSSFLKILAERTLGLAKTIEKGETTLNKITVKLFHTYWHSEQKLMNFLLTNQELIMSHIAEVLKSRGDLEPIAVFLNLHSKYDICNVCAQSLVQFSELWKKATKHPNFKVFTSFRETRKERDKDGKTLTTLDIVLPLEELMSGKPSKFLLTKAFPIK